MTNMVVAGDYKGKAITTTFLGVPCIKGFKTTIKLTKDNVASYQLIDEDTKISSSSAVGRAAVGGLLLGPIGLMAGLGAKKKGTYRVAIQFKDGCRSLIEIDKNIYKALMTNIF